MPMWGGGTVPLQFDFMFSSTGLFKFPVKHSILLVTLEIHMKRGETMLIFLKYLIVAAIIYVTLSNKQ